MNEQTLPGGTRQKKLAKTPDDHDLWDDYIRFFNMRGNPVPDLTWTWDGNEAVADYYGAGELRFTPGEDGTVILNFMNTMTYILAAS